MSKETVIRGGREVVFEQQRLWIFNTYRGWA